MPLASYPIFRSHKPVSRNLLGRHVSQHTQDFTLKLVCVLESRTSHVLRLAFGALPGLVFTTRNLYVTSRFESMAWVSGVACRYELWQFVEGIWGGDLTYPSSCTRSLVIWEPRWFLVMTIV